MSSVCAPWQTVWQNGGVLRRSLLAIAFALLAVPGCHGAEVEGPGADVGVDVGVDVGPMDATDAGAPCRPAGNLLDNGDFSSGTGEWLVDRATLTVGAGPCAGKGATVKTTGGYGSIGRRIDRATPKGTKLHLRGFVRTSSGTRAPPQVFCRAIHASDAGEVTPELFSLNVAGVPGEWGLVEKTFTLDADATGFMLGVASGSSDVPDEFGVAGVSLAIE